MPLTDSLSAQCAASREDLSALRTTRIAGEAAGLDEDLGHLITPPSAPQVVRASIAGRIHTHAVTFSPRDLEAVTRALPLLPRAHAPQF
jgi:hypothetical protein